MLGQSAEILLGILAVLILVAAGWDIRTRTIPNWLNGAIAVLAIAFWWALGLDIWPDVALRIGIVLAVFGLFTIAFALGAMGGGDVKMVGALALWLPPTTVVTMLIIMSLAGGALTAVMLVRHRVTKAEHQLEVPYGVAIAIAGIWLIFGERFLNQFA